MARSPGAVRFLIAQGRPFNAQPDGYTPIFLAAWGADYDGAGEDSSDLERRIRETMTLLVKAGCDVSARAGRNLDTPLHWAMQGDGASRFAVQVLLELGADPAAADATGNVRRMLALAHEDGEASEILDLWTKRTRP